MNVNIRFLLLVLFFQFGCETPAYILVDDDVTYKIVVNGVFTHDQQLNLSISPSTSFANIDPILTDLQVDLFSHQFTKQANISYLTPTIESDFYPAISYQGFFHLRVSAAELDTVYAIAKIPEPITVTAEKSDSIMLYGAEVYQIDLNITDNVSQDDYYMINANLKLKMKDGNSSSRDWEVFSADQKTDNEINTQTRFNNFRNIYLSDQRIVGTSNQIRTVAYVDKQLPLDIDFGFLDSAIIELNVRRVERDFYQHALTIDQYQEQLQSGVGLEKQYVKVHSNIDGGLGIFAGYSEKTFQFQIYP